MTPDDLYDFEKMKARFSRYLIEKGMRKTTERFMILDHICRIQGHFDVEMLHKQLDDDHFHVSRASIYNTIETLMDAHIVIRHQFTAQLVQYELHDAAATHHHAICSYCGAVKEIKDERLSDGVSRLRTPRSHTSIIRSMFTGSVRNANSGWHTGAKSRSLREKRKNKQK